VSAKRFDAVPFAAIKRERTEWLEPGRIPVGGVTILGGDPGLGKSQWTCLLAARLSRGELGPAAASLMLTAEDDPSRTIRPRLEAAAADLELIRCVRAATNDGFVLPDDVVELDRLVQETHARLVVIDPVSAHLAERINSWRDTEVRGALRPLADLAERYQCAVVAVMHLNKGSGMPAIYRLAGSVGFSGAPRSVLFFARDPDDPDGGTGRRRALSHEKCNLAPESPTLLYEIEPVLIPARGDEPQVDASRLKLIGESNRRGNDLLAFCDSDGAERSEAEDFLREQLANGPVLGADVKAAAKREGISLKALRNARTRLGVETPSSGFPRRTWWSLSGAPPLWAPLESAGEGHDWGNPHGSAVSEASGGLENASRAHSPDMGHDWRIRGAPRGPGARCGWSRSVGVSDPRRLWLALPWRMFTTCSRCRGFAYCVGRRRGRLRCLACFGANA